MVLPDDHVLNQPEASVPQHVCSDRCNAVPEKEEFVAWFDQTFNQKKPPTPSPLEAVPEKELLQRAKRDLDEGILILQDTQKIINSMYAKAERARDLEICEVVFDRVDDAIAAGRDTAQWICTSNEEALRVKALLEADNFTVRLPTDTSHLLIKWDKKRILP